MKNPRLSSNTRGSTRTTPLSSSFVKRKGTSYPSVKTKHATIEGVPGNASGPPTVREKPGASRSRAKHLCRKKPARSLLRCEYPSNQSQSDDSETKVRARQY